MSRVRFPSGPPGHIGHIRHGDPSDPPNLVQVCHALIHLALRYSTSTLGAGTRELGKGDPVGFEATHYVKGAQNMQRALHVRTTVLPEGRIEITDGELPVRESVDVVVSRSTASERQSIVDILDEAPGHRLFKTAKEVDDYIKEERASWDHCFTYARSCLPPLPPMTPTSAVSRACPSLSWVI